MFLRIKYSVQLLYRQIKQKKKIQTFLDYSILKRKNYHVFFGYYDISPFNPQSDELICVKKSDREDYVHICLSKIGKEEFTEIASSSAWNWQQGIRLRWMPSNDRSIIFNDYIDSKYISRVINIDSREEKKYLFPLYDISPNGLLGLTLNFERLGVMRPGYGYTCRKYVPNVASLSQEGIELVDLVTNTSKKILTYSEISKTLGERDNTFENNYINHISFSPSGHKFLFFWLTITERFHEAYLLVYNLHDKKLVILEDEKRVSHYDWIDDDNILCTALEQDESCGYFIYNTSNRTRTPVLPNVLSGDGHPTYLGNGIFITDTYPDRMGFQKILKVDINKESKNELLSIYSDCRLTGERRTDLHPRVSVPREMISIDSSPSKYREMIFLKGVKFD